MFGEGRDNATYRLGMRETGGHLLHQTTQQYRSICALDLSQKAQLSFIGWSLLQPIVARTLNAAAG